LGLGLGVESLETRWYACGSGKSRKNPKVFLLVFACLSTSRVEQQSIVGPNSLGLLIATPGVGTTVHNHQLTDALLRQKEILPWQ
jgi:hypothetical protein